MRGDDAEHAINRPQRAEHAHLTAPAFGITAGDVDMTEVVLLQSRMQNLDEVCSLGAVRSHRGVASSEQRVSFNTALRRWNSQQRLRCAYVSSGSFRKPRWVMVTLDC